MDVDFDLDGLNEREGIEIEWNADGIAAYIGHTLAVGWCQIGAGEVADFVTNPDGSPEGMTMRDAVIGATERYKDENVVVLGWAPSHADAIKGAVGLQAMYRKTFCDG